MISPYVNTPIAMLVIKTKGISVAKKTKFQFEQHAKALRGFMHENPLTLRKKGRSQKQKEDK